MKRKDKELERTLKGLGNQRRLNIVRYLKKEKEASVGDIADAIGLSFKSTSRHLSVLSAADIVEREQRRIQVFYSLSSTKNSLTRYVISIL